MSTSKKKPKTIAQIKKDTWKIFSEYIRLRDSDWRGHGACITCDTALTVPSGAAHAGHFIHGTTKFTYFHEKNVHLQCRSCNFYKNGALHIYALRLIERYGPGIIKELHDLNDDSFKWKKERLEEIQKIYQTKIQELKERTDLFD